MKITADQTRELLQLLVEVDGQSKAAAKQVFNGITPDGRLALLHDLRRRKLLAKPAPAQQLAKGEEEGEKVRAGKAKKGALHASDAARSIGSSTKSRGKGRHVRFAPYPASGQGLPAHAAGVIAG
ncbi:hypothetical protein P4131_31805 [Pseudomonas aeruginosa]|nr:hypothetical protein [Pseudomonas aeruginosa]